MFFLLLILNKSYLFIQIKYCRYYFLIIKTKFVTVSIVFIIKIANVFFWGGGGGQKNSTYPLLRLSIGILKTKEYHGMH